MTKEQIEAVRKWAHNPFADNPNMRAKVIATLDHLTTRLSEVERERDEARALNTGFAMTLDEDRQDHEEEEQHLRAKIDQLEAEVARLTHKLIDVGEMECGKCDAVGVDCGEHHPSWRWLATQARADLATLRAAVDEAVSELENLDETFDYAAFCRALDTLRNLTKPEADPLVEAVKASIEGWNNVVEMGLLPPQHHDTARRLSDRLHTALSARGGRVVFDQPEAPSERIMSDKDRENPVEGAHPTQPEGEDALVGALREIVDPLAYMKARAEQQGAQLSGMAYSIANDVEYLRGIARKALASRGLVRGEGVEHG